MNYAKVLVDLYRLKRNEKKSANQMKDIQEKKLKRLLSYAWEHSDYYRRTFTDAGITENQLLTLPLSAFPTINKKMLAEVPEKEKRPMVRKEMLNRMERILKEKKMMYVQFYVRFVKEIMPDSRTGKKPLILSECEVAV